MRRKLVLIGVVALLAVGLAVPLLAQAASVWRWSGESGWATFSRVDGDVYTSIYLDAGDGKYMSPPRNGDVFSYVYVWIDRYNAATDVYDGAWGYAALAAKDFTVANGLKSAALSATVPMTTWGGDTFDLGVNVDWAALGRPSRDHYVSHYVYPRVQNSNYSFMGAWVGASADGEFSGPGGVVFDGAADSASLMSSKSRSTSVYHYVYP